MDSLTLTLPRREQKSRTNGLTVLIDNGVPTAWFKDVISSYEPFIDYVKFGWGTSVVTPQLKEKIVHLQQSNVDYFFGGTLFEKFYHQNKVDDYMDFCRHYECKRVEISNGTVDMSNREKADYIARFSEHFTVFSEVGSKDSEVSLNLSPARWIEFIQEDLNAGAFKVIMEARESGTSGICRSNGEIRYGLIEEVMESGVDISKILFEAPNKDLQTYFIGRVGPNVNLANVAFTDIASLETLRLGLRSDTFLLYG